MRHKIRFSKYTGQRTDDRLSFTVNEMDAETVINVQGVIGDSFDGLDAVGLVDRIQSIDGPIRLRINTPGGGVFDAVDAYQALVEHPAKVTADIIYSWSAGTILASAADEIRAGVNSVFGIHRAHTGMVVIGNSEELRKAKDVIDSAAGFLEEIDGEIATVLADRSGNKLSRVKEWMVGKGDEDGTEWVGRKIVEAGFADTFLQTKKKPTKQSNMRAEALRLLRARAGIDRSPEIT